MWNKIILKWFQCFISHVTTDGGYMWNIHWNYFTIISVFYFTHNHIWNYFKIISASEIISELFQRHWTCFEIFMTRNKPLKLFWNIYIPHVTTALGLTTVYHQSFMHWLLLVHNSLGFYTLFKNCIFQLIINQKWWEDEEDDNKVSEGGTQFCIWLKFTLCCHADCSISHISM